MDSWRAAPGTNKLLYEDDHVRLIEVTLRPGETEQMHGDPYPSVLASDAATGEAAPEDRLADRSAALNAPAKPGVSPKGFPTIACSVSAPRAPHALHNGGKVPVHFYRIEFKRVDGKDLATRWRQWYPWMAKIADEYVQHPYVMNY